ncbi:unnamed protein product [Rotaria sp. Silwood2]|nr:unnamed protein product [Rotaria sp. Silwood2]CAF2538319.1 unnamed protein product [Rotaria sp. Silwood2]CAF4238877.1 unnamed protein product [Rotaria sp. Silwood2]CAF4273047.1 unnamed protein product [Rotaria sp. Silwood2]
MSSSICRYQLNPSKYQHSFSSHLIYLFLLFNEYDYSIRIIDLGTTAKTNDILKLIQSDSNIELAYTRAEHFGTLTLVIVGTIVRFDIFCKRVKCSSRNT